MQTGFPAPLDDDSEDVAWGLTTGAALWKQGDRHDALIWLKRAVVAANEAGQQRRADELNRAATRLIAALAAPSATSWGSTAPAADSGGRSAAPAPIHSSAPPLPFGPSSSGRIQVLKPLATSPPPSANHLVAARPPVGGPTESLRWAEIEPLGELRAAQRERLLRGAVIASLSPDEEMKVGGLALMLDGQATVQPTVSDVPAATLNAKEFICGQPSIPDAPSLRLVAASARTRVATWERAVLKEALADTPDTLDRLRRASDRVHALAGTVLGALGERLDESLRSIVTGRLEVRVLEPQKVIAPAGLPVPGIVIVGVGTIELDSGDGDKLGPGDFLFPTEVLGAHAAPCTALAGPKGAIILFGARALAHELLVTCPPLLEIFSGM